MFWLLPWPSFCCCLVLLSIWSQSSPSLPILYSFLHSPTIPVDSFRSKIKVVFWSTFSFVYCRYFKQSAATFFGLDESKENELRQRWEDRRRRLAERRCGTLRESCSHDVSFFLLDSQIIDRNPIGKMWHISKLRPSVLVLVMKLLVRYGVVHYTRLCVVFATQIVCSSGVRPKPTQKRETQEYHVNFDVKDTSAKATHRETRPLFLFFVDLYVAPTVCTNGEKKRRRRKFFLSVK